MNGVQKAMSDHICPSGEGSAHFGRTVPTRLSQRSRTRRGSQCKPDFPTVHAHMKITTTRGSGVPAEIADVDTITPFDSPMEQANEGRGAWTAGWCAWFMLYRMHMPLTLPVARGGGERHMLCKVARGRTTGIVGWRMVRTVGLSRSCPRRRSDEQIIQHVIHLHAIDEPLC